MGGAAAWNEEGRQRGEGGLRATRYGTFSTAQIPKRWTMFGWRISHSWRRLLRFQSICVGSCVGDRWNVTLRVPPRPAADSEPFKLGAGSDARPPSPSSPASDPSPAGGSWSCGSAPIVARASAESIASRSPCVSCRAPPGEQGAPSASPSPRSVPPGEEADSSGTLNAVRLGRGSW